MEDEEELSSEQAALLHKGSKLTDGPYTLSYNDDGAKYYYLKCDNEVHSLSYSFKRVEWVGETSLI